VNSSGGSHYGGEGIEKAGLRDIQNRSAQEQAAFREAIKRNIIYVDPMDLTKMLDIPPGTEPLNGVRDMLKLYYPD